MRLKLALANLVTVLVLGLVAYFVVRGYYSDLLSGEISAELSRDRELFERSMLLQSTQHLARVTQRAAIPEIAAVYAQTEFSEKRAKASGEADAFAAALAQPQQGGRAPEFVALTDLRGGIIARNFEPSVFVQRPLGEQHPSLSFALNGTPARDVWMYEGNMLDVAFAPIRVEGRVAGALLAGFEVSNGVAEENARLLGAQIAFFIGGRVYSSSLRNSRLQTELTEHLFKGPAKGMVEKALQVRRVSDPFEVSLGEKDYLARVGPLPGEVMSRDSGYVVLSSLTDAMAPVAGTNAILWLTAIACILAVIIGFALGGYFLKPVEQIEEGVLRVINGDTAFRIEIKSSELGGLAYRINQLIATFLGESEEDEEGASEEGAAADLEEPK